MENMNFLTEKYKEKLEIENYVRKFTGIFLIILVILYILFLGLKEVENSLDNKINLANIAITKNNNKILEIKEKSSEKTDVGMKIELLEGILSQNKLEVSEVLKNLSLNIPENVWLSSLIYKNNEIRIKGFSFKGIATDSTEKNTYSFEENLLNSGLYERVSLNYLKEITKYGEKINEFEYILILKK